MNEGEQGPEQTAEISYPEAMKYVLLSIGMSERPIAQTDVFSVLPKPVLKTIGPRLPKPYYESRSSDLTYLFLDNSVVSGGLAEWIPGLGIRLTQQGEETLEKTLEAHEADASYMSLIPELFESIKTQRN